MASKHFINSTSAPLSVTLFVRKSDNPDNNAGVVAFTLNPGENKAVSYGDNVNIYLNGLSLVAYSAGSILSEEAVVTVRGSSLDSQLNTNNTVRFQSQNNAIGFACSNS